MYTSKRPFFWGVAVAGVLMLGFYLYAGWILVRYGDLVRDFGWTAAWNGQVWKVREVAAHGAADGKLAGGDVVLSVNGDERAAVVGPFFKLRVNSSGDSYSMAVARGSSRLQFDLSAPVRRDPKILSDGLSKLLASLGFCVVGIVVGLLRPGERIARIWVVAGLVTALAALGMSLLSTPGFLRGWERYPYVLLQAYPFNFLFGYSFLYRFVSGGRARRLWTAVEYLLWGSGLVVFFYRISLESIGLPGFPGAMDIAFRHGRLFPWLWQSLDPVVRLFAVWAVLSVVPMVAVHYRWSMEADHRRRLKWFVYGTAAALLPGAVTMFCQVLLNGLGLTAITASPAFQWVSSMAWGVSILIPVSLGYAIAKHRVMGVEVVIRRGIQYLLARNVLRLILLLPVIGLGYTIVSNPERTVAQLLFGRSTLFYLFMIASTSISLKYRWHLTGWVDRKFFRAAYDQERILTGLIERVKACLSREQVSRLVCGEVEAALHPACTYLFYRAGASQDFALQYSSSGQAPALFVPEQFQLVRMLERRNAPFELPAARGGVLPEAEHAWLCELGVELVVPVSGSDQRLFGLLLLGEKKSEELYAPNDRKLLQAIAAQIAVVYENLWLKERVEQDSRIQREVLAHLDERRINLLKECPACGACFDRSEEACPHDRARLTLTLPVERTIEGRYRLDRLLGRGGMGAVYEACDLRLQRPVALKIMLGGLFGNTDALRRFEREARASAQLNHPNIIAVHDYGRIGNAGAYLVMELLRGSTWRAELSRRGTIDPPLAADWFDQALAGLGAAHQAGVVHRDLKPENLMITSAEGATQVRILDFGLAKIKMLELASPETRSIVTQPGAVIGTFRYMSPEQLAGQQVDERTDFFALGVMVVESLTGLYPFHGENMPELHLSVMRDHFHLNGEAEGIRRLDAAVQKCLARDPQDRFSSAAELRCELVEALRQCPPLPASRAAAAQALAARAGDATQTRP